jgi:hypothetical protein
MLDEWAWNLYAGPARKGEYAKNEFDLETARREFDDDGVGRLLEASFQGSAPAVPNNRVCQDRITTQNSVGDKSEDTIPALCVFDCDTVP